MKQLKFIILFLASFSFAQELKFESQMVLPLTHYEGDPMLLFSNDKSVRAFPGWNALSYPATVILDLQGDVSLSKMSFIDMNGNQTIKIEIAKTLSRTEKPIVLYNKPTDGYDKLTEVPINQVARFIYLTVVTPKAEFPPCFKFYGTYKTPRKPLVPVHTPGVISRSSMGFCTWPWIKPNKATFVGYQRLFCEAEWPIRRDASGKQVKGNYNFDNGGGEFKGAEIIANYKAQSTIPVFSIQGMPEWIPNGPNGTNQEKGIPAQSGSDQTNPDSFKEIADYYAAWASRFKSDAVLELGNELNKWWQVKGWRETVIYDAYFNPFVHAAFQYASYTAMKKVAPDCIVSTAGLANLNWKHIRLMSLWFEYNTPEKTFAADIIAYHHYCTDGKQGISPEQDKLLDKLTETVSYTKAIAPGKKVFLGESGYDLNESYQAVKGFTDKESVQGSWLTRIMIISSMAGVDNVTLYNIADNDSYQDGLYNKSGVLTKHPEAAPKKSYNYIKSFAELIGSKSWSATHADKVYTLSSGTEKIIIDYSKNEISEVKAIAIPVSPVPDPVVPPVPVKTFMKELNELLVKWGIDKL